MNCAPQASEEGVHFIVSRQIRLPTPDILQEAPWGMDGPPPYSPVDIEQTLLVSSSDGHSHWGQDHPPTPPVRGVSIRQRVARFHIGHLSSSLLGRTEDVSSSRVDSFRLGMIFKFERKVAYVVHCP